MESKTLKGLLVFAKVCRIISTVVFVCCIVGASLCVLGLICFSVVGSLSFGGNDVSVIIMDTSGLSVSEIYSYMAVGLIACVGEGVIAKFGEIYFKNVLKAGTPFTKEGSFELLRLSLVDICASVIVSAVSGITVGIVQMVTTSQFNFNIDFGASISAGLVLLLISFILKCGTELITKKEDAQNDASNS